MKDLVEYIVKQLVTKPDEIKIVEKEKDGVNEITICVAPDDTGKIIGKQGRIAMAIRTVVKAAATKDGKKYSVEIVDSLD